MTIINMYKNASLASSLRYKKDVEEDQKVIDLENALEHQERMKNDNFITSLRAINDTPLFLK